MTEGLLLDTHALIWWQADAPNLSARARSLLRNESPLLISPVSLWELSMLVSKQRLRLDRPLEDWIDGLLADPRTAPVELEVAAAVNAGRLEDFHGDPADRLLVATAVHLDVPFLSKDTRITEWAARNGVEVVW